MDMNKAYVDRQSKIVDRILNKTLKAFKLSLHEANEEREIESRVALDAIVSSTAMSFFTHVTDSIIENMNFEGKLTFLEFMRKHANYGIDLLIAEVTKKNKGMQ